MVGEVTSLEEKGTGTELDSKTGLNSIFKKAEYYIYIYVYPFSFMAVATSQL